MDDIDAILEFLRPTKVLPWSEEMDGDEDPWFILHQAEKVADAVGIRISSQKELIYYAKDEGAEWGKEVVGGLWHGTHRNGYDGYEFSYDMVVLPEYRGVIGIQFINAMIQHYKENRVDDTDSINVWVVNRKLAGVLERRYGFAIDADHGDGGVHMSYHAPY